MSPRKGRKPAKRTFGSVRKLPSGRYQVRYTGEDGATYSARTPSGAPLTFTTRGDADMWLSVKHIEMEQGDWKPVAARKAAPMTLREFADAWLADRGLAVRTAEHYQQLLRDHIYPTFGDSPVTAIEPAAVRKWNAALGRRTGATARAHSYSLLRAILNTAVSDDLVAANPCRVRAAGQSKRQIKIRPATIAELAAIIKAMPAKYQLMVLLAAWCALRFGELAEMRRSDVDLANGLVHVRRGVVRTTTGRLVKDPKTEAGKREVHIPPHLIPVIKTHLAQHAAMGRDGLLFPGSRSNQQLAPSALYRVYYPARDKAGRPDLRFHDLRHTGAVLAAATGATIAELMARLGHSTAAAAMRYQHAASERDREIAGLLSDLATGEVTSIDEAPSVKDKKRRRA
jgi:integrase